MPDKNPPPDKIATETSKVRLPDKPTATEKKLSSKRERAKTTAPKKPVKKPRQVDDLKDAESRPKARSKKDHTEKVTARKGDSTARVSITQPNQLGPNHDSEGKTTDTRGNLPLQNADDHPRPRGAEEQRPTAAEIAERQPLRQTQAPTASEKLKVDGEDVEVYVTPSRVDPVQLTPGKRDTLVKDQLRHEGRAEEADAPRRVKRGGDWLDAA